MNSESLTISEVYAQQPLAQLACCRDLPADAPSAMPASEIELPAGYVLDGRFIIGQPLSFSGMATIYEAEDKENHLQPVVVKVPHPKFVNNPDFYSRFLREQEIGEKLQHPYILKFIHVNGRKSRPYLVTERLRGCTLARLMVKGQPLPEKDALRIASLVCEAVRYMHSQGIVHRDLKPDNIMLCADYSLRLLDFGIVYSAAMRRLTVAGVTPSLGTPDYMAPEQVVREPIDERTDIYGLGAILYEMLTGHVPFRADIPSAAMNARVTGDPVAPRKLNPQLSPQAEEIVLHALQRNPAGRYASTEAFQADLDAPERVQVTGYNERLQKPSWSLFFQSRPILSGILFSVTIILIQVIMFFVLWHHF